MDNKSKRVYDRSKKPNGVKKKDTSFSMRKTNKSFSILIYCAVCVVLLALTLVLNVALYSSTNTPPLSNTSRSNLPFDRNSRTNSHDTISDNTSELDKSEDNSSDADSKDDTTARPSSSETEASSQNVPSEAPSPDVTSSASDVPDDGKSGYLDGGIYIYNNIGFELFYGSESSAKYYAKAISDFKNSVGDDVNVYNLVIPNHTEFGLPAKYSDQTTSQYDNINTILNNYSADIKPVNIYDTMKEHKDEYIYFNTDHHWTALGAYYGYTQFAKAAGFEPISLSDTKQGSLENFSGSLINATSGNADLQKNLDTVYYYEMPGEQECEITTDDGDKYQASLLYPFEILPENSYSVFIWGDNPYMTIKTDVKNGKKIMVVKESYGNAFVPYLAANYEEIYVVDFRYYQSGLESLIKSQGIQDVLFINGIMSANNATQVQKLRTLFY